MSKEIRGRAVTLSIDEEAAPPGTMLVTLAVPMEHLWDFRIGHDYIVTVPEGKPAL